MAVKPVARRTIGHDLLVDLDRETGPLHRRLTAALRAAMRGGQLADGDLLPPSRTLARQLGVSRWVVVEAYAQLAAEGHAVARPGSGTVVRAVTTDRPAVRPHVAPAPSRPPRFDLAPGIPDLRAFPHSRWAEAYRQAVTGRGHAELDHPAGTTWASAAAVVGDYLHRVRAATDDGTSVCLTRGSTAVGRVLARDLAAQGHRAVAVEDPSWPGLRNAFRDAGVRVVPIAVDDHGLQVPRLFDDPLVRAVIVTPAHQFPTGVALSADRRRELLDWAGTVDGLIIEDDYDAEFRYDHRPVACLQGMAPDRVVLLGSVSKTLAPALGLGWIVLPERCRQQWDASTQAPSLFEQAALSTMISRGWYERHLVRTRQRYRRRRQLLLAALAEALPSSRPSGIAAGLHMVLPLPDGTDPEAVVAAAAEDDLRLTAATRYRVRSPTPVGRSRYGTVRAATPADPPPPALVIGYGNLRDGTEQEAARRVQRAVRAAAP